MRTWSRRRKVLVGLLLLVGLWLVASAYLVLGARSQMVAGARILRRVRNRATVTALVDPANRDDLLAAEDHFERGRSKLDSVVLSPWRLVPVASRHVVAARRLAAASQQGTVAADRALADIDRLVARPHATGGERVGLLRDLSAVASRTDRDLAQIEVGSGKHLVRSLGDAVEELRSQRDAARVGARRMRAVSSAAATILDGPEPYLVLGANNGEMRNGSGMFLSAATLGLRHGTLRLGEVHPTADIVLPAGRVPVRGQLAVNWPWLDPGRDLRNLGLTPDFPQSARLAVENWAATPVGSRVGGVIVIDVDGIRALLRAVGPVDAEGVRYTAENVRGELLRKQYQRDVDDRQARRDRLGLVARAVFERLEQGRWKVADLASELVDSVQGRHLMVWSKDAKVEQAWRDVGADGHLTSRTLSVGLLNRGATKTDSYVDTSTTIRSLTANDGRVHLTITYRIANHAPAFGPRYVVGPNVAGVAAGDHRALVVANLPGGSTAIKMSSDARTFLVGQDGPTEVVGGAVTVRRGRVVTVTITAVLPRGLREVVLEPAARIDPTAWTVDGERFDRDRRRTVAVGGS
jgi:hypothetical protein